MSMVLPGTTSCSWILRSTFGLSVQGVAGGGGGGARRRTTGVKRPRAPTTSGKSIARETMLGIGFEVSTSSA